MAAARQNEMKDNITVVATTTRTRVLGGRCTLIIQVWAETGKLSTQVGSIRSLACLSSRPRERRMTSDDWRTDGADVRPASLLDHRAAGRMKGTDEHHLDTIRLRRRAPRYARLQTLGQGRRVRAEAAR